MEFVRSMEVTQKVRKPEFKSLDQVVTRIGPDGKRRHANSKCVDFLNEMISVIGVSKPILENVIFCHQEESNWPLDESKKVKDKFDAIFNATKYIKCLDTMRKLRAEKKLQVKNMRETLSALRYMKEIADQKKGELNRQQDQLQEIKEEQKQASEEKVPLRQRIKEIEEVEHRLAQVSQDLGRKENKITMLQESNKQDATDQNHQIVFSDEELNRRFAEYQATMSLKKAEILKVQRHITEAEKEVQLVSARQVNEQRVLAKLEAEQEQHQTRLQQRNQKMLELVKRDVIPALKAYSGRPQLTGEEAERALESIGEHIQQEQERLDARSADLMRAEDALQTSLNTLRSREAALAEEVRGLDARITGLERQLRSATQDLAAQRRQVQLFDAEALAVQLRGVDDVLLQKEQAFDEEQARATMERLRGERDALSGDVDSLKRDVSEKNKQAALRAELAVHEKEISSLDGKITQLFRKNKDTLDRLLPVAVTEESLKTEFDNYCKNLQKELNSAKSMLEQLREKRSKNQVAVDSLRRQQEEKQSEVKTLEERISDACPDQPLETALAHKKDVLESLQRESGELESTATVMERYIEKLTVEDCCPLCHRDFGKKEENLQLRDELRGRVSQLPARLHNTKERLARAEQHYNTLLQLQPFREQLQGAQAKLRQIQSDLTRPLAELSNLNSSVEDCEMNASVLGGDLALCQAVQEDVVTADTHGRTRRALQAKMDELNARLGDQAGSESLEKATERLEALEGQLKVASVALEEDRTRFMKAKEELVSLRNKRNNLAQKEIELKTKQQSVQKKEDEVQRLQQEKLQEQKKRDERSQLLPPAKLAVKEEQVKKDRATAERNEFIKDERAKIDSVREVQRPLQALQANISAYQSSNGEQRLTTSKASLERLQVELVEKLDAKKLLEEQVRALEKEQLEQREYERSLNTEKKIRQRRREIADLQEEVDLLKKKIATAEQESLGTEKHRLVRTYNDLEKKFNLAHGRAEEVKKHISALETELRMPKFKEAVQKYQVKMLHIKCTEMAGEDLNKYYLALDTAIMKFHAEKMTTINRIIHQLWVSTYRGNDVDKIEIKTDATESKGADKRRTYNYRVVMYKQGAEMDMRGRCSAGQKVLASLIIRMALAETFSHNCGILALDEPTTNLDRENIDALISALVGIVNQRAAQRNFQLIVITHDDDFLRGLTRADDIKDYYKVFRDRSGLSCIRKMDVNEDAF